MEGALPEVLVQGTCPHMCSVRELEERQQCMEVNFHEAEPGTELDRHPRGSHALAVKRYARPAAGRALPIPAEVRPIGVLERTTEHLISLADSPFAGTFAFIADRLRAVVQDLVVQGINDGRAATIYERIVRFHALSAVRYAEARDAVAASFSAYHNHELLSKALVSLMHIYANDDTLAGVAHPLPRAEFHGYHLLLHASDTMMSLSHASALTPVLHASEPVVLALQLLHAVSARDGLLVLRLVRDLPPTAVGCAIQLIPQARDDAVSALRRAHLKQELLPARWVCSLLLLPTDADALRAGGGKCGLVVEGTPAASTAADEPAVVGSGTEPALDAFDALVVRVVPTAEAPPPAQKELPGQTTILVATAGVAAWRQAGMRTTALVESAAPLWPAGEHIATSQPTVAEAHPPAPPQPHAQLQPVVLPEPSGGDELLDMMNMLRVQINARPDFLLSASAEAARIHVPADGASVLPGGEDDELALALKDAIASMMGGGGRAQ
jgi:hypothetical protein